MRNSGVHQCLLQVVVYLKKKLLSYKTKNISGKPPERSYSPTMRHTAHGILKSQQSLASEILRKIKQLGISLKRDTFLCITAHALF